MSTFLALIAPVIAWIGAALVLLNLLFWVLQPGMVFYPTRTLDATPADWGLPFEDLTLPTPDGETLHGWFVPSPGATKSLLFLHGNAGNISHRGASIEIFHRLGLNVLIIDYRGYGRSTGTASEDGVYLDARAAWDYLVEERHVAPQDIVIFGRSLGGAIAVDLAARVPAGGLILESSFSSARDVARHLYPLLSSLVRLRMQLDSEGKIGEVSAPLLILHSPSDEIIPYSLGRRLFDAAPEPKRFADLIGGHNDGFLLSQPAYQQTLNEFLADLPALRERPPSAGDSG